MKSILPGQVKGTIDVPTSKSFIQRFIAISSLVEGRSILKKVTFSDDVNSSLDVIKRLGSKIERQENDLVIHGRKEPLHLPLLLNVGESGFALRVFSFIASLFAETFSIDGEKALRARPVTGLIDSLKTCGLHVTGNSLPLIIKGRLKSGDFTVSGKESSQIISGLLIAVSASDQKSQVTGTEIVSGSYLELTSVLLKEFGSEIIREKDSFYISPNKLKPCELESEGDWSSASFLLVMGALCGEITCNGLSVNSQQGDKIILQLLESVGVDIKIGDNITVAKRDLKPFIFDATHTPDLFPPLVSLAVCSTGRSIIKGVTRLKGKESDRGEVLKNEFGRIGAKIEIEEDQMIIDGGTIRGGDCSSNGDHRIAMALAVAGLASKEGVNIYNPDCVSKSYPDFFRDLKKLVE